MEARKLVWRAARAVMQRWPALREPAVAAFQRTDALRHAAATVIPGLIRPEPRDLTVAVTARCNLRCEGCRYGRDFMPGAELPLDIALPMLDDAAEIGFERVRFYGGEPLLHRDLPRMIEHAIARGLDAYVTTNATLLDRRIDELHHAGLRCATVGFYGTGSRLDEYVERRGTFARVERGIAAVRDRYGDAFRLRLNWLLMRPTCDPDVFHEALDFARRYKAPLQVDLIHYSLPYFTEGRDRRLQFRPEDRERIERLVDEIVAVKLAEPRLIEHTVEGLRSIPDWLLRGADMRVPCDKYRMIWVGADGTVQLCYVTFRLGDLKTARLRDLLFTPAHRAAARGAFAVDCPNCHCSYDNRIVRHFASRRSYAKTGRG